MCVAVLFVKRGVQSDVLRSYFCAACLMMICVVKRRLICDVRPWLLLLFLFGRFFVLLIFRWSLDRERGRLNLSVVEEWRPPDIGWPSARYVNRIEGAKQHNRAIMPTYGIIVPLSVLLVNLLVLLFCCRGRFTGKLFFIATATHMF